MSKTILKRALLGLLVIGLTTTSLPSLALEAGDADPKYWESLFQERDIPQHADLVFDVTSRDFDGGTVNVLFKPKGATVPFGVVVVIPTCGGVSDLERRWAKSALERGYGAFILDPLRGASSNCVSNPKKPVKYGRITKDAYDLVATLSKSPDVDKNRVFAVGGSMGGMVAGFLASPTVHGYTASKAPRYRATASLYGCGIYPKGTFKNQPAHTPYFFNDSDRPLLWMTGAGDTECVPTADKDVAEKIAQSGKPLKFVEYPDATHCWDCEHLNGKTKTGFYNGSSVTISYNFSKSVTDSSWNKVFEFFDSLR